MRTRLLLASLVLSGVSLSAQWVTNGDFSAGLSSWTQTGYSYNPQIESWDVTGMGASSCFACSPGGSTTTPPFPPNTLDQTITIVPGIPYELSADLASTPGVALSNTAQTLTVTAKVAGVEVAKTTFGLSLGARLPVESRARLCGRFVTTASGQVTLSIEFARSGVANATSSRVRIDNVSLQIAIGPTFNLDGPRRIGFAQPGVVSGAPGATYAVFLAAGVLPGGVQIPGVSGLWYLDPLTTATLMQGTLDGNGLASVSIAVPNITYLTLAPTYFQPAQIVGGGGQLGFHFGGLFTL